MNIRPTNTYSYINLQIDPKKIINENLGRVIGFALPLLNFYRPLSRYVAITSGSLKVLENVVDLTKAFRHSSGMYVPSKENNQQSKEKIPSKIQASLQLCATVALIGATIFNHRLAMIATASQEVLKDTYTIGQAILNKKYDKALRETASLALHSIQLASILTPSPQLILISLVAQVAIESYRSWQSFQEGKTLEGVFHLILCGLYGYQVHQEATKWLSEMSPLTMDAEKLIDEFLEYKKQLPTNQPAHFKEFLQSKGYSSHLADIDFGAVYNAHNEQGWFDPNTGEKETIKGTIFEDLTFTRCSFNSLDLSETQIKNCRFKWSSFINTNLNSASISKTQFDHCDLINTRLGDAILQYVTFFKSKISTVFMENSIWNYARLMHCDLSYIYGNNTTFDHPYWSDCEVSNSDFIESYFKNGIINDSTIKEANFKNAQWQNMLVSQTNMTDSTWGYARLTDVVFKHANLSFNNFFESQLTAVRFHHCPLEGAFFLDAQVRKSAIYNSDLTNCLLYKTQNDFALSDCTTPTITKPIIALSVDLRQRGVTVPELFQALKACKALPVKIDAMKPLTNYQELSREVKEGLEGIGQMDQTTIYSVPNEFLRQAQPESEVGKIKSYARYLADHVDGMVIPGGADIEAEFYGEKTDAFWTDPDEPYQRTVFEYALFDINHTRNQPIVGICRGCQMGATYHGAKLLQHVEKQSGFQEYKVEGGSLRDLVGEEITGLSMHHQGVKVPVKNLVVTIRHNDIAKALEHPNGSCHLYQFHPEYSHTGNMISFFVSGNNKKILKHSIQLADKYRQSRAS